jgi:hypothetical protein
VHARSRVRLVVAALAALLVIPVAAPVPAWAADATTTVVSSLSNPSTYGSAVFFSALVTSGGPTPTGTVQFAVDGVDLGSPVTLVGGSATSLSISTLTAGSHAVTAVYDPLLDPGFDPSTGSLAGPQVVNKADQAISFTSAPPVGATVGGPTYLVATTMGGGSGNPVLLKIDDTASTVCSLSGSTVSFTAAGLCVIDADQAGDGNYNVAAQVQQSFTVLATQTITFGPLADKRMDEGPVTVSATASSGLAVAFSSTTPPAVCTVAGVTVTLAGVGTCTIDANQIGNGTYAAAPQQTQTFSVAKGNQTITFGALADKTLVESPVNLTATASSGLLVTFESTTPSVCTVSGTDASLLTSGTCFITAKQGGDTNWDAAQPVTQTFSIAATATPPPTTVPTLTVTAEPKSRPFGVANPAFTAVISGFVNGQTLATSGVTGSPVCTSTATLLSPAGTYPITCSIGTLVSATYTFVFVPGTLTIVRGSSSVTLSATTTVFETSTPATFAAAVEPGVAGAVPSGSLVFTIDGVARPPVGLDASGRGSVTVTWTTTGVKSVGVSYAGDGSFAAPGTASAAPSVVANTARATGVGVTGSTIYPIVDSWRDTLTARGIRSEPLGLAIEVKNAKGSVVRRYSAGPAAGAYAWAWNGRTSKGALVLAGRYTVVQTLTDPYGSRPRRTVTSSVTVSLKKMRWTTKTITTGPGPRCFQLSSGDGVGSYSCSSTAPLRMAGDAGHWPGVGYQFLLPSATGYRSIRIELLGSSTGPKPAVGFHDWRLGSAWGQLYRPDWRRTAISPTATRWAGLTATDPRNFISGRTVRVYVDGGGRLDGAFSFDISRVRLVVSVGTLQ